MSLQIALYLTSVIPEGTLCMYLGAGSGRGLLAGGHGQVITRFSFLGISLFILSGLFFPVPASQIAFRQLLAHVLEHRHSGPFGD